MWLSSKTLNPVGEKQNPLEAVPHHDELLQFLGAPVGPQEVVAQLLGAVRKIKELSGIVVGHLEPPLAVCLEHLQPQQAEDGPLQIGMRRIKDRYSASYERLLRW